MTKKIIGVLLALCALTTSYAQDNNRHNFDVTKNLEVFNTVYKYLDMMYVDTLNANEVVRYGLGAMLNSLDPYTVYYPADDTKELDLMLTGRYGGIGAIIATTWCARRWSSTSRMRTRRRPRQDCARATSS